MPLEISLHTVKNQQPDYGPCHQIITFVKLLLPLFCGYWYHTGMQNSVSKSGGWITSSMSLP